MSMGPKDKIDHVFVLMLENRSFDHMQAWSGNPNLDPPPAPDSPDAWCNTSEGIETWDGTACAHRMDRPVWEFDDCWKGPGHSFANTFRQLTGQKWYRDKDYHNTDIDNSGFLKDYYPGYVAGNECPGQQWDEEAAKRILGCYGPEDLGILNQLGAEFAICDRWFSSLPGSTIPNRLFALTGSSGGMDDIPYGEGHEDWLQAFALYVAFNGLEFFPKDGNGRPRTILDRLKSSSVTPFIYKSFALEPAIACMLQGVEWWDTREYHLKFNARTLEEEYVGIETFSLIEPFYDILGHYRGNSQHPLGDVRYGEELIKDVYETIRSVEEIWEKSLLIITYDEHGGFYDHVPPPGAPSPGDNELMIPAADGEQLLQLNQTGFDFERFGVRVPAVVVSPWIERGSIATSDDSGSHYDHTSIISTVCELWGLDPLTRRDEAAHDLLDLIGETLRTDAPTTLKEVPWGDDDLRTPGVRMAPIATAQADSDLKLDDNMWLIFCLMLRMVLLKILQVDAEDIPTAEEMRDTAEANFPDLLTHIRDGTLTRGIVGQFIQNIMVRHDLMLNQRHQG